MEKIEVIFATSTAKKHSIRFSSSSRKDVCSDVYVMRSAFGSGDVPKRIKVTIEEVK
jgi:hypothetical protein